MLRKRKSNARPKTMYVPKEAEVNAAFDNVKVIFNIIFIISYELNFSIKLKASGNALMRTKSQRSGASVSDRPKSMPSLRRSLRSQSKSLIDAKKQRFV